MPKCNVCGIELNDENWYPSRQKRQHYICKDCHKKRNRVCEIKRMKQYRKILHGLKINGCSICGYNKCDRALDFHHVNPEDKEFHLDMHGMRQKNISIANELNKCILLCKNCHYEIEELESGA